MSGQEHQPGKQTGAAERQRRYRARRRDGARIASAVEVTSDVLYALAIVGRAVEHWSLTTLREKDIRIGARVVRHGRYITFQLAEVAHPESPVR